MSIREPIQPAEGQGRPSGRIYWLDVARVVAILSITLNHAVNRAYTNIYSGQMKEYLTSSILSNLLKTMALVFSEIGVPLFLMISGALLLKKRMESEADVHSFYRHNLLGLFITSEIWYVIMYWFILLVTPGQDLLHSSSALQLIWGMIKTMLFVDQVSLGSMWYIPMILCIYLVVPLFAMALKRISLRTLLIPCMIVFAGSFLFPSANSILSVVGSQTRLAFAMKSSNLFSFYMLFVLLGYWIGQGGMQKVHTIWVTVGALTTFAGTCAFQMYTFSRPMDFVIDYDFIGILLCAPFTFELIRRGAHWTKRLRGPVIYVSKISFGIYFVHILIMSVLFWYVTPFCRPFFFMLFLEAASVGGSIILIVLLSQIPLLKQYLFMIKDGEAKNLERSE